MPDLETAVAECLQLSDSISIPLEEIEFSAIRAQGAGGQNVNKVASAIHLRFDIANSSALPAAIRDRLLALNDQRITASGQVVIKAQKFRTQERNKLEALERLADLILPVLVPAKPRKKSRVPRRVKEKRLAGKRKQSQLKQNRARIDDN